MKPTAIHYSPFNLTRTFDSWKPYYPVDFNEYPGTIKNRLVTRDTLLLPNVPLIAKATLLAEILRKGRHVNGGAKFQKFDGHTCFHPKNIQLLRGRMLGIEIEYYPAPGGVPSENLLTDIATDGSLGQNGREIRRLTWPDFKTGRLEGLLAMNVSGRVDKTCGLHVHVDARHLGSNGLLPAEQVYDRLILFSKFLKCLVPRSRRDNSYCAFKSNRGTGDRYCAINWQSFRRHHTIEFRCQAGSINKLKIESWALLCRHLVNFAACPDNTIPHTWPGFIAILPEPIRSWALLRKDSLYGNKMALNERTLSAVSSN